MSPDVPEPKAPPRAPVELEQSVQASRERERRRQLAAMGRQSTILTSPQGLGGAPATTNQKTLLGQ